MLGNFSFFFFFFCLCPIVYREDLEGFAPDSRALRNESSNVRVYLLIHIFDRIIRRLIPIYIYIYTIQIDENKTHLCSLITFSAIPPISFRAIAIDLCTIRENIGKRKARKGFK